MCGTNEAFDTDAALKERGGVILCAVALDNEGDAKVGEEVSEEGGGEAARIRGVAIAVGGGDGGIRRREEEEVAGDDGMDSAVERAADSGTSSAAYLIGGRGRGDAHWQNLDATTRIVQCDLKI